MLDKIREVLEANDGCCLDNEEEREKVSRRLEEALTKLLLSNDPETEEAEEEPFGIYFEVKHDHVCPKCGTRPKAFSGGKYFDGGNNLIGMEGDFECADVDCQYQWHVATGVRAKTTPSPAPPRDDQMTVTYMRPERFVIPKTWFAIVKKSTREVVAMFASSDMCSDVLYGENDSRPSYFDEHYDNFEHIELKAGGKP